jgi:HEPN domain-containing protein
MKGRKEFNQWTDLAGMDLSSARFLRNMEPIPGPNICFLCHQSAEKYLKAFLVFHNVPPKKTHDLIQLSKECIKLDPDFDSIKNPCADLNVFSIEARYPSSLTIESNDVDKAPEDASAVSAFIVGKLPL